MLLRNIKEKSGHNNCARNTIKWMKTKFAVLRIATVADSNKRLIIYWYPYDPEDGDVPIQELSFRKLGFLI